MGYGSGYGPLMIFTGTTALLVVLSKLYFTLFRVVWLPLSARLNG